MPRNAQGLYTLPSGNPVISGTEIESVWANTTMDDIAAALTASLPRDGSAPMTGPLILSTNSPQNPKEAASKAFVEQFMAFASGMPVGAVTAFAGTTAPPGWLLCDGSAVSRTTYDVLFAAIGVTYGPGDASTTFNLPDMRDEFIRGRGASRVLGSKQSAAFASHNHGVGDPGHAHTLTDPGHAHGASQPAHTHGVNDPGHAHGVPILNNGGYNTGSNAVINGAGGGGFNTTTVGTGISTQAGGGEAVTVNGAVTGASAANNATGITIGAAGGDETRPQNIAQDYYIKAVNDSAGSASITGITTNDPQMISVDNSNLVSPELVIHSNVAFGTVKLDASGQIPLGLLPSASQQLLGYWNASGGQTPSQASPSTNFASGDTFIISVTGLLTVFDPVTLTASPTTVAVGSLLQYIENSLTNPTGWYYVVGSTTVVASQVGFTPAGTIAATNVQSALVEVDGDVVANAGAIVALNNALGILDGETVKKTSDTGSALLPAGTTAQRDPAPQFGAQRANSTLNIQEWWNGTAWVQLGGMSQVDAEAAFLQVDGGNQMLAPLVFNTNANSVVRVGAVNVAQFPTTTGVAFCKNKLFNGEVTRINQRGFDGNWTPKGTWNSGNTIAQQELCYGWDMWAKASATDMVQLIEAGNFRPSTVHTISGTGVTTQQITSPASGNWAITVPQAARNVQVEEGEVATPFETRPISFELSMCQRYYEVGVINLGGYAADTAVGRLRSYGTFSVSKRATPSVVLGVLLDGANLASGTWVLSGGTDVGGFAYLGSAGSVGSVFGSQRFTTSAVI